MRASTGSAHGVAELIDAELPLEPEDLPLALTLASKALTGAWAHYPVAAGGGTTVWVLIDDERLALGEPELKPVVKALASGITGLEVSDHRTALASYAQLRGLRTAPLPDGGVRILCVTALRTSPSTSRSASRPARRIRPSRARRRSSSRRSEL